MSVLPRSVLLPRQRLTEKAFAYVWEQAKAEEPTTLAAIMRANAAKRYADMIYRHLLGCRKGGYPKPTKLQLRDGLSQADAALCDAVVREGLDRYLTCLQQRLDRGEITGHEASMISQVLAEAKRHGLLITT